MDLDKNTIEYWRTIFTIDDNGIVQTLGKFEGEHWYTLPYYAFTMLGTLNEEIHATQDSDGFYAAVHLLDDYDYLNFPEFSDTLTYAVNMVETNSGFWCMERLTLSEYEQLRYEIDNPVNPATGEFLGDGYDNCVDCNLKVTVGSIRCENCGYEYDKRFNSDKD